MNRTQQTLLEQMRISDLDISARQDLLGLTDVDLDALGSCQELIRLHLDELVDDFYEQQTSTPEIASLIGDADTMQRLVSAQHNYIADLFGGEYGRDYVNNRLRIGLVHKRIGVEPKLYLSAVYVLRSLITKCIRDHAKPPIKIEEVIAALDKLLFFDITLVFETYIQSMLSELENARMKTESYARALEENLQTRTGQLRNDPLTGLTNRRYFDDALQRMLRAAQRRAEPVCLLFLDLDGFKQINDTQGHDKGDEVLKIFGGIMRKVTRGDDICVRYGGDEFCAVLANCTKERARSRFSKRVTDLMAERLPGVTVSIGVAQTGPEVYLDPSDLLVQADRAMYEQKARRKSRNGSEASVSALKNDDSERKAS